MHPLYLLELTAFFFFWPPPAMLSGVEKQIFNLLIESTAVTSDFEMCFQVTHFLMGKC